MDVIIAKHYAMYCINKEHAQALPNDTPGYLIDVKVLYITTFLKGRRTSLYSRHGNLVLGSVVSDRT